MKSVRSIDLGGEAAGAGVLNGVRAWNGIGALVCNAGTWFRVSSAGSRSILDGFEVADPASVLPISSTEILAVAEREGKQVINMWHVDHASEAHDPSKQASSKASVLRTYSLTKSEEELPILTLDDACVFTSAEGQRCLITMAHDSIHDEDAVVRCVCLDDEALSPEHLLKWRGVGVLPSRGATQRLAALERGFAVLHSDCVWCMDLERGLVLLTMHEVLPFPATCLACVDGKGTLLAASDTHAMVLKVHGKDIKVVGAYKLERHEAEPTLRMPPATGAMARSPAKKPKDLVLQRLTPINGGHAVIAEFGNERGECTHVCGLHCTDCGDLSIDFFEDMSAVPRRESAVTTSGSLFSLQDDALEEHHLGACFAGRGRAAMQTRLAPVPLPSSAVEATDAATTSSVPLTPAPPLQASPAREDATASQERGHKTTGSGETFAEAAVKVDVVDRATTTDGDTFPYGADDASEAYGSVHVPAGCARLPCNTSLAALDSHGKSVLAQLRSHSLLLQAALAMSTGQCGSTEEAEAAMRWARQCMAAHERAGK